MLRSTSRVAAAFAAPAAASSPIVFAAGCSSGTVAQSAAAWSLARDQDGFTIVYGSPAGVFRMTRSASAPGWQTSPLTLPGGGSALRVGLAKDEVSEHIVVQTSDATYYGRTCH